MHVILTGGTGTIGLPVLHRCLSTPDITRLSVLSRRPFELPTGPTTNVSDPAYDTSKAEIIVHTDYTSYPAELLDRLRGAQAVIWAQGVSQSEVPKDVYTQITYDAPLAAAKAFSSLPSSPPFTFVYVSAAGADPTEKTWALFGKVKGRAERELLTLADTLKADAPAASSPLLRAFNVRPTGVMPGRLYPEAERERPWSYRYIIPLLMPPMRFLAPSMLSPTDEIATVLVDLALGKFPDEFKVNEDGGRLKGEGIEGGRTIVASAMRRWAALRGVVGA
ncbi:hypothetical protein BD626DRAFT_390618 [Schizophyllum amplum]|uniref:NAD(P)-binding domain-containing protein n=1 Tax=Schizophyllum amplum TaxID=97359 RepID=A0A550CXQ2_9AGAR|nr:hypothetical protein BD626DRAFT_390618 [Auriculariopsis ampla]